MYKRLRNIFTIGCVAILVAAFIRLRVQADRAASNNPTIQESTAVDRGDITLTVSATGPIHAQQEVPLAFLSFGKVATINVAEGDHVLKGQTLATLDTTTQQTALKNAQLALNLQQAAYNALTASPRDADLKAAKAALAAAKAQLGAAQVGYDPLQVQLAEIYLEVAKNVAWQTQLQRDMAVQAANSPQAGFISSLYGQINTLQPDQRQQALAALGILQTLATNGGFLPDQNDAQAAVRKTDYDVQIATAQLAAAKDGHGDPGNIGAAQLAIIESQAELDKLTEGGDAQSLAIAKAQLKAAQAALDLANYNVSQATLYAPFDGVVAQMNLTLADLPPKDKPAVIMLDDRGFYVEVPVDEADISKVAPGQSVSLVFDSLPNEAITGTVGRIADTALAAEGVVTYLVHVDIDSAGHPLRAGMSTTATITVSQVSDVLRIRNRFVALDRKTGRATVMVLRNGHLSEVEVVLGLRNETYSEVKSGLAIGDVAVILPRDVNLLGN